MNFRFFAYPIVNMQVINAVWQIRYVELYLAALGGGLAEEVALAVVEAEDEIWIGCFCICCGLLRGFGLGNGFNIYFDVENVRCRIWINDHRE